MLMPCNMVGLGTVAVLHDFNPMEVAMYLSSPYILHYLADEIHQA